MMPQQRKGPQRARAMQRKPKPDVLRYHHPTRYTRWVFLWACLFNVWIVFGGIAWPSKSTYYIPSTPKPAVPVTPAVQTVVFVAYLVVCVSIVLDALLFIGWFPGWLKYRRVLMINLCLTCFFKSLLAGGFIADSLNLHTGYIEPSTWIFILLIQFSISLSMLSVPPPPLLRPRWPRVRVASRLRAGLHAFSIQPSQDDR